MFGDFDIEKHPPDDVDGCIVRIPIRALDLLKQGDYRVIKKSEDILSIIDENDKEVGYFKSQPSIKVLENSEKDCIYHQNSDSSLNPKHAVVGDSTFGIEEDGPLSKEFIPKKSAPKKIIGSDNKPIPIQNHVQNSFLKSPKFNSESAEQYLEETRQKYANLQRFVEEKLSEIEFELLNHPKMDFDQQKIIIIHNAILEAKQQMKAEEGNLRLLQQYVDKFTQEKL